MHTKHERRRERRARRRSRDATSRDRGGETADAEDGGRGLGTRSVHAGQSPDPETGAMAPPIYQTTSYVFEDADTAAARYALEDDGYIYSRIANPTVTTLEDRLADLEGGAGAVATGSGMAALDSAVLILAEAGDNVVCSTDTYGGTTTYFSKTATRRDIEPKFVPTLEYDAYEEAIDEDTAFVHVETIGNPSLVTPDFERVAEVAHDNGASRSSWTTPSRRRRCVDRLSTGPTSWGVDDQVAPRLRHHSRRRAGRRRLVPLG